MSQLTSILVVTALLGSGLICGVFFAFSTFIMQALANLTPQEGIRAMQSINRVVLNPAFLGVFTGTAIVAGLVVLFSMLSGEGQIHWLIIGSLFYIVGTFLVTGLFNVPLNDELADSPPHTSALFWADYLKRWTFWNHVRTINAFIATLALTLSLLLK
jgi:uncharacterized membrane protein